MDNMISTTYICGIPSSSGVAHPSCEAHIEGLSEVYEIHPNLDCKLCECALYSSGVLGMVLIKVIERI
jgi:hypothetical protein